MSGYATDIDRATHENDYFRSVLYTDDRLQLVVMSLQPGEDIGEEMHNVDQFFRVESGSGKAIVDGAEQTLSEGYVLIVPAGAQHNIINTSTDHALKLYTIYTPPQHPSGTVHKTKEEALAAESH